MKRIDDRDVRRFQELTQAALSEPENGAFIEKLLQREKLSAGISRCAPVMAHKTAGRLYSEEMQVIERLEAERSQLLAEIERYARSEKAMRSYRSQFPLPPIRPFFEKKD